MHERIKNHSIFQNNPCQHNLRLSRIRKSSPRWWQYVYFMSLIVQLLHRIQEPLKSQTKYILITKQKGQFVKYCIAHALIPNKQFQFSKNEQNNTKITDCKTIVKFCISLLIPCYPRKRLVEYSLNRFLYCVYIFICTFFFFNLIDK